MSTRPVVSAEPREVVGKKVSNLRREGVLPAVGVKIENVGRELIPAQGGLDLVQAVDAHELQVRLRT